MYVIHDITTLVDCFLKYTHFVPSKISNSIEKAISALFKKCLVYMAYQILSP